MSIALVIVAAMAAWTLRWSIVPASNREGNSAFVLDRWTGAVSLVSDIKRYQITDFAPTPKARPMRADEFLDEK
ncbi:hypothetical protein O4H66_17200 [Comamonadaceae bacterium G21597-S1]|nr:hypothetical protein [Comamonadaceae bacterium G21597-S1]